MDVNDLLLFGLGEEVYDARTPGFEDIVGHGAVWVACGSDKAGIIIGAVNKYDVCTRVV